MTESLARAIGRNARALRLAGGITLEQLAAAAVAYGLPWSSGRVGDFEGGRVSPNLPTIYVVALALRDTTGQPVTLSQLLDGAEDVELTRALTVPIDALRGAVSGKSVTGTPSASVVEAEAKVFVEGEAEAFVEGEPRDRSSGGLGRGLARLIPVGPLYSMREVDYRIAKNFNLTADVARDLMYRLWGKPFSAERDQRSGSFANAQRKGQVSRSLKAEIAQALEQERAD